MTKVELELIFDANFHLLFEEGMRRRVSYLSKRYSKANNNSLKSCDSKQKSEHIINLDANNLYGYSVFKFSPNINYKLLVFVILLLAMFKIWYLIFLIKKNMCFIMKTCNFI